ncbi:DEKNAAC101679 [Brettanomyces naardenensis]|uniref:Ribonuclease P protein subunit n=1 Tax=Brettanomyces naardenensis TaxID=13370 RepID=A0A448YIW5_BRENA|nr:DEKNAAC101679 [Brettanomyces naardenensis]
MNRENAIERLLLSRCSQYHDDGEILKTLEQRYSLAGAQKNYLVLEPTDGGTTRAEIEKSSHRRSKKRQSEFKIFGSLQTSSTEKARENKHHPLKTKNEFKRFIKSSLALQAAVTRKIKRILKKNPHYLDKVADLASLSMCKKILKFEDFVEMNRLWNSYIQEVVKGTENMMTISTRLSTCELIGALIEVTHSGCVDNVGKQGIIIWESQHNFAIVSPRSDNWKSEIGLLKPNYSISEMVGGIKLINKQDTRFKLSIDWGSSDENSQVIDFEIIGDRLMVRSIDRANKKFKNHSVKDIKL